MQQSMLLFYIANEHIFYMNLEDSLQNVIILMFKDIVVIKTAYKFHIIKERFLLTELMYDYVLTEQYTCTYVETKVSLWTQICLIVFNCTSFRN